MSIHQNMLSSLVSKTKAVIGIVTNYTEKKSQDLPHKDCIRKLSLDMDNNNDQNSESLLGSIYDCIRTIKDPEKPASLEDLQVVYEDGIKVQRSFDSRAYIVEIEFNPTVPHCSLATLIGLCMRIKVERNHMEKLKLDIHIKKGAHDTEDEINKQINDKERVAAAMENPNLREMVEKCISEDD